MSGKKVGCIIQARMGSTRLPGKTLLEVAGKPLLGHMLERLARGRALGLIVVATSKSEKDDAIEAFCREQEVECFRGSEEDVLERYYKCAKKFGFDVVVRLTGDCPLADPKTIGRAVEKFLLGKFDYLSNVAVRSFPRGLDVEVFSFGALEKAHRQARKAFDREHVTHFIYGDPKKFKIGNINAELSLFRPELRLCVDTKEDVPLIEAIFSRFGSTVSVEKAIEFIGQNPKMAALSRNREADYREKAGFIGQLTARPVNFEDRHWILKLMNQESVRKNSFNSAKIEASGNDNYWQKKLSEPEFRAFAITAGKKPAGLVRIDKNIVSIAINKSMRHKGIAFAALSGLDLNGCIAEVQPENKTSISLFKKLGFEERSREKNKIVFGKK